MQFTKIQAAGNDYVLVETSDINREWPKVAAAMLDRHYGIGADGLLLMMPSTTADFKMRIFNADGSESEACGNGLRCTVKYYADKVPADTVSQNLSIETLAGIRRAVISRTGKKIAGIKTSMGEPKFGEFDIPVKIIENRERIVDIKSMLNHTLVVNGSELNLNFVSMGNPHAVYFSNQSPVDFPLAQFGPAVEKHQVFPEGTNFEVARIKNRKLIEVRVWERGVGETLACGSGACAVAVAAELHDYIDNKVDIKMPGGMLEVEWGGAGEVYLSGPAEKIFSGEWSD